MNTLKSIGNYFKSSELQKALKSAKVGETYEILKQHEEDIYSLAQDGDTIGLIETLIEEGGLKKIKARVVANKLIKSGGPGANQGGIYNNNDTEIEHTTLNHHHGHNGTRGGQYEQKQQMVNYQQEVVVRGQVLLDATKDALKTINDYLKAYAENPNGQNMSFLNEKANTALKLYRGNCKILRKKQKQDKKLDFSTAFNAAEVPINEYENEIMNAIQNKGRDDVIQRLNPMLNYMRCTLRGIKPPKLPETNDFIHNKRVVKDAMGQALKGMNHTIPDRIKSIESNAGTFHNKQKELAAKAQQSGFKRQANVPSAGSLQQDINKPLYQPASRKEMEARLKQDLAANAHREPYDVDYGHYDEDSDSCGLDGDDGTAGGDDGADDVGDFIMNGN